MMPDNITKKWVILPEEEFQRLVDETKEALFENIKATLEQHKELRDRSLHVAIHDDGLAREEDGEIVLTIDIICKK